MQKETEQYNNTTLTELVLLPKINHRQECARSSHFGLTCLSFAFIWLLLWPGRINVEHRSLWKNVSKQSKQQLHFSAQHNHENERFVIFFFEAGLTWKRWAQRKKYQKWRELDRKALLWKYKKTNKALSLYFTMRKGEKTAKAHLYLWGTACPVVS